MRPIVLSFALALACGPAHAKNHDDEPMAAAMRAHARTLSSCYQLAADARAGKGLVSLQVHPGGDVSDVTLDSSFSDEVARCVLKRVRAWRFTAFDGAPRKVSCSVVFVGDDSE